MKEIILCKYGEITLKGANRSHFEHLLKNELARRTAQFGKFKIYYIQSTAYIEPLEETCDITGAYEAAKNTFGVSAVSRAIELPKDMNAILEAAGTVFMPYLSGVRTLKVE